MEIGGVVYSGYVFNPSLDSIPEVSRTDVYLRYPIILWGIISCFDTVCNHRIPVPWYDGHGVHDIPGPQWGAFRIPYIVVLVYKYTLCCLDHYNRPR